MIKDPATLALVATLVAIVAVVASCGWALSWRRNAHIHRQLREQADEALAELRAALAASEVERGRLGALAGRLPQLEATVARLSKGLRAGADELRRLGLDSRQQRQHGKALRARNRELLARLQMLQVRYNEAARLLAEAQAQNARLEEELSALKAGTGTDRPPARAPSAGVPRLRA